MSKKLTWQCWETYILIDNPSSKWIELLASIKEGKMKILEYVTKYWNEVETIGEDAAIPGANEYDVLKVFLTARAGEDLSTINFTLGQTYPEIYKTVRAAYNILTGDPADFSSFEKSVLGRLLNESAEMRLAVRNILRSK